jgi:hypothetical protein
MMVLAAALAVAAAAAAGCGSEREFDEASVTEALNEAGAGLVLGEPLPVSTEGIEVHQVSLGHPGAVPSGDGHTHGDGALIVLDDSAAAEEEFARCQSALDFTCFRAANVVLRFTGMSPVDQQLLSDSVSAIATEED